MDYNIFWGDMHTQFHSQKHLQFKNGFPFGKSWREFIEISIKEAKHYLDFYVVIYYPAYTYTLPQGLTVESVGMKDGFQEEWKTINNLVKKHNSPGEFVTFAGYEWTGDRTRWGDHNVVYFDENRPLDLSMHIETLYNNLEKYKAIVIPHHTGYMVTQRGKDWDHYNKEISPFAEIFSSHGSSEGCNTPYSMYINSRMAPRVSGGTLQDGLNRGCKLGIIASGDNVRGFAGRWGTGLFAVCARELTREGIWEAFQKRRVYAVTGDRIRIDFKCNNHFMGDVLNFQDELNFEADIIASHAVDRVELIKNGKVVDTKCYNGSWDIPDTPKKIRIKLKVEFGWGPTKSIGFSPQNKKWRGKIRIRNGKFLSVEKCFTRIGQRIKEIENGYEWNLTIYPPEEKELYAGNRQALVFEVEGYLNSSIHLNSEEIQENFTIKDILHDSKVFANLKEVNKLIKDNFGLEEKNYESSKDICNILFGNSYRIKVHKAILEDGYRVKFHFKDKDLKNGNNYYHPRLSQLHGQLAWTSPIRVRPQ